MAVRPAVSHRIGAIAGGKRWARASPQPRGGVGRLIYHLATRSKSFTSSRISIDSGRSNRARPLFNRAHPRLALPDYPCSRFPDS